jgi:hypothetical protein
MRIDGYPIRTQPQPAAAATKRADAPEGGAELSMKEKLRRLLEEKRSLSESAFESSAPAGHLGRHIDLRV